MTDQQPPNASTLVSGPVWTIRSLQPEFPTGEICWGSFDVPRLWDSVRREGDEVSWEQIKGFENMAQLLYEHREALVRLRDSLANSWNPERNPAAAEYFAVINELVDSMSEDAAAHASTARAVDRIVTAMNAAKEKIGPLKKEWDSITSTTGSDAWEREADRLNNNAREIMRETEKAVQADRQWIVIPVAYAPKLRVRVVEIPEPTSTGGGVTTSSGSGRGTGSGGSRRNAPPPVPGYDPIVGGSNPELDGLSGLPQPVPAVPGSPISLLPIPPGNPYAPNGGAYVLPGPGVGQGGWIHPMPLPSGMTGNQTAMAGSRSTAAGASGMGMAPVPTPMGGSARRDAGGGGYRDGGGLVWDVAQGVDPVIGEAQVFEPEAEQPESALDDAFVDWFGSVATPWSDDLNVTIRRRSEPHL
jgi:hypothetical protein